MKLKEIKTPLSKIVGLYEITYESNGFKQFKILISDDDYDNIKKPLENAIIHIESLTKGKENPASKLIKETLKMLFYDSSICINQRGPMGQSISSGILILPKNQGGEHKVKWRKIKK
jgi:hypothetical protein